MHIVTLNKEITKRAIKSYKSKRKKRDKPIAEEKRMKTKPSLLLLDKLKSVLYITSYSFSFKDDARYSMIGIDGVNVQWRITCKSDLKLTSLCYNFFISRALQRSSKYIL